ncbi:MULTISPECIES: hypothetical protein [unclassified Paenibacillus]|uniref:hypothetical protein n=1 Tax=unclassified Paenibacillus TaxID=185978 RepID=UPI0012DC7620|nr:MULTISPECIES: hypothetical protein [unclassified Paenibacillus]
MTFHRGDRVKHIGLGTGFFLQYEFDGFTAETDAAYVEFDTGETISVTVGLLVAIDE